MVINIRLADVTPIAAGVESMGRTWYGYEPSCTDVALWAQNRGRYAFAASSLEGQRFATLSYRGQIMVVAAYRAWEEFADYERGIMKKALIGDVLGAGDPAYDALIGRAVPSHRAAFEYLDDTEYGIADLPSTPITRDDAVLGLRSTRSQGWQSDPVRRKQVEDAAQDRLMAWYSDRGWDVVDTRFGNPYDAVATNGDKTVYLEAKGTETAGDAVLVSAGEVRHALAHPGQCVMGVLSDIRFDVDGSVIPGSGVFRMLPFQPEDEALAPTAYTWTLPTE